MLLNGLQRSLFFVRDSENRFYNTTDIVIVISIFAFQLLQYNVPGSNLNRGLALVHSYKMFCPKSELNDENLHLTYVLGWCVEIVSC